MTVRKRWLVLLLAAAALAPRARAQGDWVPAKCDISPGHYLVNSGILYLRDAAKTTFTEQRTKDLADAHRVLTQALTSGGQDKNPAAWYYLARYYAQVKDLAGADSAFRRAEAMAPKCHDDISMWRRNLWVPVFNAGVAQWNAGNSDSAIKAFRNANAIYRDEPTAFTYLGELYFNGGQADSALPAFEQALAIAQANPKRYTPDSLKDILFNLAATLESTHQSDSARAMYALYLKGAPNDVQALAQLAGLLSSAGMKDSARSIYRQIVAHGDSAEPLALFAAGVSIYNSAGNPPDTAALGRTCREDARKERPVPTAARIRAKCDGQARRAMADFDSTAVPVYRDAAAAFEAGLKRNPDYRDALFNLANTYLVLKDGPRMLDVARRLVAVDPLGQKSIRLLAQAFQLLGKPDSTLYYVTQSDSLLPLDVAVGSFQPGDQQASISGLYTNFHDQPSAPLKLTFEFLDAKGAVVATSVQDVAPVPASGNAAFQFQVIGSGIVAWRYRRS